MASHETPGHLFTCCNCPRTTAPSINNTCSNAFSFFSLTAAGKDTRVSVEASFHTRSHEPSDNAFQAKRNSATYKAPSAEGIDGGVMPCECEATRSPVALVAPTVETERSETGSVGSSTHNSCIHSSRHAAEAGGLRLQRSAGDSALDDGLCTSRDISPSWRILLKKSWTNVVTGVPTGCSSANRNAVKVHASDGRPPSAAIGRPRRRSQYLTSRISLKTSGRPSSAR
mmetsp:Transcript_57007/g.165200  ORF Transcript_57007/g.165200 Transcript_57007/m.165200 type:complete len:228 (-) Transcript_57007:550-1233(-)